jgi:hypothetical protein
MALGSPPLLRPVRPLRVFYPKAEGSPSPFEAFLGVFQDSLKLAVDLTSEFGGVLLGPVSEINRVRLFWNDMKSWEVDDLFGRFTTL